MRIFKRLLFIAIIPAALGAPYLPREDGTVLERLPDRLYGFGSREIRDMRSWCADHPDDLDAAVLLAEKYIERNRADADPRYLGYAQSTLARWWRMPEPPVKTLVLRGIIRQSNHEFDSALTDLDAALRRDPRNPRAWLTRATVLQVQGRFDEAKRSCLPLFRWSPELVSVTAATGISSLTGSAEMGYELLRRTVENSGTALPSHRAWALTVLAEIAERLGRLKLAEQHFKEALSIDRRDAYRLAAFADFLLACGRPKDVAAMLKDEIHSDGLLLRLALAEQTLTPQPPELDWHVRVLDARFEAGHRRGSEVHLREEALFKLRLKNEASAALRIARANWDVQREPIDARILLEASISANDPVFRQMVTDWIQAVGLEDIRLARLLENSLP